MTKEYLKQALKNVMKDTGKDTEKLHEYMLSDVTYERLVPIATDGTVLTKADIGNGYQGDHLFLVKKGDEYARIVTGYGTCSGCDALYGCESWNELVKLVLEIRDGAIWHDKAGMIEDLHKHDAEGSWYGAKQIASWNAFKRKALAILEIT